ncbi:hypothetical protein [Streptomyces purpureus]|uniref:Uncharacterized protein n=1 Tax=Streptomyces purpureus TaxID=1951 RepID=A0A918GZ58_9ACTN|nr:hypothetical protein [Streptomyces purpureus]GGT20315.1 hypothetical protein GCM10014713_11360 [Streptomyces purpureus]
MNTAGSPRCDDGCTLQNTRRFRESTDELRELARHILARYGTGATFHTNITGARNTGTLDFTSSGQAWVELSLYSDGFSLVVVSEDEVGLFTTFGDFHGAAVLHTDPHGRREAP